MSLTSLLITVIECVLVKKKRLIDPKLLNGSVLYVLIQTRFQKSWDTVQIVNKKGMQ